MSTAYSSMQCRSNNVVVSMADTGRGEMLHYQCTLKIFIAFQTVPVASCVGVVMGVVSSLIFFLKFKPSLQRYLCYVMLSLWLLTDVCVGGNYIHSLLLPPNES